MTVRKIGVEEELLLVDPDSFQLTAMARRAVRDHAAQAAQAVEEELFLQQIETASEPASTAEEVAAGIRAGRRAVGEAAAGTGARAVAMGVPVLEDPGERITPEPRYERIMNEYGAMAGQALACAMHLHIDVDSDEEAVGVSDRVRPWLPLLLALSSNSPIWRGEDTGHASWRSQIWSRWPTGGVSEPYGGLDCYRSTTERLVRWGAGLDQGMLYFDVRLAASYPTIEVRVADVCTEVDDAVLVALLSRALVTTEAAAWSAGEPVGEWRADLLKAATWRAARYGVPGQLVNPATFELGSTRDVLAAFVDHVRDALDEAGDTDVVHALFEQLLARGSGAMRQRSVRESTGALTGVVSDLADRTEASWASAG